MTPEEDIDYIYNRIIEDPNLDYFFSMRLKAIDGWYDSTKQNCPEIERLNECLEMAIQDKKEEKYLENHYYKIQKENKGV